MLPDVLTSGLDLVVCGSAVGPKSAAVGAYYAGPGNRFWSTLASVGLTPRQLAPHEYHSLCDYGIGLTDLAKCITGVDRALPRDAYDPNSLRRKLEIHRPRFLCFNGKAPAKAFLDRKIVALGLQSETLGATAIFVAPSTSRAANAYWDVAIWRDLARLVRSRDGASRSQPHR